MRWKSILMNGIFLTVLYSGETFAMQLPDTSQKTDTTEEIVQEVEAIVGWWQTNISHVRLGEPFTLIVTFQYVETPQKRVVFDSTAFDPLAIDVKPFEVVGRVREYKIRKVDFVFRQYLFVTLRLMDESFIGKEVALPAVKFSYRLNTVTRDGAFVQGAENMYVLPKMPIKVLSIVPKEADDIRDIEYRTLDGVQKERSYALFALLFAIVLGFSAVAILFRAVFLFFRRQSKIAQKDGQAPALRVRRVRLLWVLLRRFGQVFSRTHRAGWNEREISNALALSRLAASAVLKLPIAYGRVLKTDVEEGQVVMVRPWFRKHTIVASSSLTGERVHAAAEELKSSRRAYAANCISCSLDTFTRTRHESVTPSQSFVLDQSLLNARSNFVHAFPFWFRIFALCWVFVSGTADETLSRKHRRVP